MSVSVVIMFDFDGTLVDSMKLHRNLAAKSILKYFSESGITFELALEKYDESIGIPFSEQLKIIFPKESEEKRRLCLEYYVSKKIKEVYDKSELFEKVSEELALLKDFGIPLIVSTSTEELIAKIFLKRHSILDLFDYIKGLESGPKKDHLYFVREKYKPEIVFFVGDSILDVKMKINGVLPIGKCSNSEGGFSRSQLIDAGALRVIENFKGFSSLIKFLMEKNL